MRLTILGLLFSLAVGSSTLVGCAADTSADLEAVDEASDEVVAVSKLVGTYESGQGRFSALTLEQVTENGRRVNRYTGKQVVMCVRAPCPARTVKGKWFARGSRLSLYPEVESQPRETYSVKLEGTTLTLSNAQGVAIAELTKALPAPAGVAAALQKHGVPKMKVEIDAAEVAKQAGARGVTVSFADALDSALGEFLTAEDGLKETTGEFADDLRSECGSNRDLVRCLANAPRTTVRLQKLGDETAPQGEDAKDAWVFVFFVDDFTDHGYFAVVDKKGQEAPYVYSFN